MRELVELLATLRNGQAVVIERRSFNEVHIHVTKSPPTFEPRVGASCPIAESSLADHFGLLRRKG